MNSLVVAMLLLSIHMGYAETIQDIQRRPLTAYERARWIMFTVIENGKCKPKKFQWDAQAKYMFDHHRIMRVDPGFDAEKVCGNPLTSTEIAETCRGYKEAIVRCQSTGIDGWGKEYSKAADIVHKHLAGPDAPPVEN